MLECRLALSLFPLPQATGEALYDMQMATADLNGDGRVDLVSAGRTSSSNRVVGISINTGDGSVAASTHYTVPTATRVLTADFDADGDVDVLAGSGPFSLLLNAGNGTLAAPLTYASDTLESQDIAASDLNGDGLADVVLSYGNSRQLRIYLNTGNAGAARFTTPILLNDAPAPFDLAPIDFDGDGDVDLATSDASSSARISFWINDGDASFSLSIASLHRPSESLVDMQVADVDQDGKSDIVAGSRPPEAASGFVVYRNSGGGVFQPRVFHRPRLGSAGDVPNIRLVRVADLNGDGYPDVACKGFSGSFAYISVSLSDRRGGFVTAVAFPSTIGIEGVTDFRSIDLTGDGRPELVMATPDMSPPVVAVARNRGNGYFEVPRLLFWNLPAGSALGDLTGDGKHDLLYPGGFSHFRGFSYLLGNGDGTFGDFDLPDGGEVAYADAYEIEQLNIVDVDADGDKDVVAKTFDAILTFVNDGVGRLTQAATSPGIIGTLHFGDFDDDDSVDIAATTVDGLRVMFGDGSGAFLPSVLVVAGNQTQLAVGDLNGDGRTDLLYLPATNTVPSGGRRPVWIRNNGTRQFAAPVSIVVPSRSPTRPFLSDVDGDGDRDLILFSYDSSPKIDVLKNSGAGTFGPATTYTEARYSGRQSVVVADVNRDGREDLIYSAGSSDQSLAVRLADSNGGLLPPKRYEAAGITRIWLADLNLDGTTDLLVTSGNENFSNPAYVLLNLAVPDAVAPVVTASNFDPRRGLAVSFGFSEALDALTVEAGDLVVRNLTTGTTVPALAVGVSSGGRRATFTLPADLADGDYRFEIGGVVDRSGNAMVGMATSEGPDHFVLRGDVNRDRSVDFADLVILAQNYGRAGRTFGEGNIDYSADGAVGFSDLVVLAQRYGATLPPPLAVSSARGEAEGRSTWERVDGSSPVATGRRMKR